MPCLRAFSIALLAVFAFADCVVEPPTEVGAGGALEPSTPVAEAIRLANTAPRETLVAAGLHAAAADRILQYRRREPIDDAAELGRIPLVGPVALQRLLLYWRRTEGPQAWRDELFLPASARVQVPSVNDLRQIGGPYSIAELIESTPELMPQVFGPPPPPGGKVTELVDAVDCSLQEGAGRDVAIACRRGHVEAHGVVAPNGTFELLAQWLGSDPSEDVPWSESSVPRYWLANSMGGGYCEAAPIFEYLHATGRVAQGSIVLSGYHYISKERLRTPCNDQIVLNVKAVDEGRGALQ